MAIESTPTPMPESPTKAPTGWLQVSPQWLASFFGLAPTGEVTVVLGLIRVGVTSVVSVPSTIWPGWSDAWTTPTGFRPVA